MPADPVAANDSSHSGESSSGVGWVAHSRVVKMMVPNPGETKGAAHPQNAQQGSYRTHILVSLWGPFEAKYFALNGGDDGARTRDLCRDSYTSNRNS
jgi:hypothetical protein